MPTYKILVVDDDPDDRDLIHEAFSLQGSTEHLVLSSADQVLNYLQNLPVDDHLPQLIITDLNMPRTSGIDLLRTLKGLERYRQMEVVVYSSWIHGLHAELCLALGAREYITKPAALEGYQHMVKRLRQTLKPLGIQ